MSRVKKQTLSILRPLILTEGDKTSPWVQQHATASRHRWHGQAIAQMLRGWSLYAKAHKLRYGSPIAEDGYLGEMWMEIGLALRGLLDGELGGFDGGSLDHNIRECLLQNGYTEEEIQ